MKETRMLYVASVITFSVFSELLWKSTLLVHYRLNIFWRPWVNPFDICVILFVRYAIFVRLDKFVLYG